MNIKLNIVGPLRMVPKKSNICPECGEAQIFKWDHVGDGRNITLTSLSHEECNERIENMKSIGKIFRKAVLKPYLSILFFESLNHPALGGAQK